MTELPGADSRLHRERVTEEPHERAASEPPPEWDFDPDADPDPDPPSIYDWPDRGLHPPLSNAASAARVDMAEHPMSQNQPPFSPSSPPDLRPVPTFDDLVLSEPPPPSPFEVPPTGPVPSSAFGTSAGPSSYASEADIARRRERLRAVDADFRRREPHAVALPRADPVADPDDFSVPFEDDDEDFPPSGEPRPPTPVARWARDPSGRLQRSSSPAPYTALRFSPQPLVRIFNTDTPISAPPPVSSSPVGEPPALTPVGEPPHLSPVGEGPGGNERLRTSMAMDDDSRAEIMAQSKVKEAMTRIVLQEVENPMHLPPSFGPEEDVKLDPRVYRAACERLNITPQIDLFASNLHHQVANYCTVDNTDGKAIGVNAFNYVWDPKWLYYANPPWTLIGRVLKKTWKDGAKILLVTPEFKKGAWKEVLVKMTIRFFQWDAPLYLDEQEQLRPRPKWLTRFSIIQNPAFRLPLNPALRDRSAFAYQESQEKHKER